MSDFSRTPFLSNDALIQEVADAQSVSDHVRIARRYVSGDPVFDEALLFTLSEKWRSSFPLQDGSLATITPIFSELESAFATGKSIGPFLEILQMLLHELDAKDENKAEQILGAAALVLMWNEPVSNTKQMKAGAKHRTKKKQRRSLSRTIPSRPAAASKPKTKERQEQPDYAEI